MNEYDTASSISMHSECDCYICQYERYQRDPDPYPFCKSARNPVIYYARTSLGKKKDCNTCRKPNFFVRAFRWYTKEHIINTKDRAKPIKEPCKNECQEECSDDVTAASGPQNMGAFATWLDNKYNQYLMETADRDRDACRVLYTQTSLMENCVPGQECQDSQGQSGPCGRKRFFRFKSNLNKVQKRHGDEKETCERERKQSDTPSTEFIMAPKNMSRAASVCCYPTPANSAGKNVAKSRSATVTVCTHRSGFDSAEFSKPPVEETYGSCQKCKKKKSLSNHAEVSCQHSAAGQNAETQYEPDILSKHRIPEKQLSSSKHPISSKQDITSPPLTNDVENANKNANKKQHGNVICECLNPDKPQVKALKQKNQSKQQPKISEVPKPNPIIQEPYPTIQQQSPNNTQQLQGRYKDTYSEVQQPCLNFQQTCPDLHQSCPYYQQPCPNLQQQSQYMETREGQPCLNLQQPCSEFNQPCPYLQQLRPNVPKPSPSTTQQQQTQYHDTNLEVSNPYPGYQHAVPSMTRQVQVHTQGINTGIPTPSPSLLQPRPSQTQQRPIQYQETYSGVPRPCPTFQEPCLTLDERAPPETCPSVREPCVGRKPCPSLRKECPPCPAYKQNVNKTSVQPNEALKNYSQTQYQQQPYQSSIQMQEPRLQQNQQNEALKANPQLQYQQQPYQPSIQETRPDSQRPTYGGNCCAKTSKNVCCARKQMPTLVEPNFRVGEMPLKQEEYSPKTYATKTDSRATAGPSNREASTGTNPNSVQAQGTTLLFAQHQNSANCYCSNCCPSGMSSDRIGSSGKNEVVHQLTSNQNVLITMTAREGKCSTKCPYYSTVSIKGQNTQTSQNVQFSQSVDQSIQTSDNAIRLDRGTIEYPLYMRVVRADKLQ